MSHRVPPYIHYRTADEEIMLLDERTDTYFSLNPTAAIIWTALAEGASVETASDAVVAQAPVAPEVARADALALVADLVAQGLLEATK